LFLRRDSSKLACELACELASELVCELGKEVELVVSVERREEVSDTIVRRE
jgi:hypothetical protein